MNTTTDAHPFDDFEAATMARPATGNQLRYVEDLREQFDEARQDVCALLGVTYSPTKWGDLPATREQASAAIERGKAAVTAERDRRRQLRAQRQADREATLSGEDAEGMWIIGVIGDDAAEVWKVQRAHHGSGQLYAKLLDSDGTFGFVRGALTRVMREGRKMTLDEAKAYGKLYGICCRCAATLTDENSIAAGIGPICAAKF